MGIATCLAATAWAGTTAGAGAAVAGSPWQVLRTVNQQASQTTNDQFLGMTAAGASDVWAVGLFDDKNAVGHPLAEHWDGTAWTLKGTPRPAGRSAQLAGVDELSPSNVWAVGLSEGSGGVSSDLPLIEHWDGTAWSIVPGVSLPGGASGALAAVGGTGPDDLWAVGYELSADQVQEQVLFEHFDGSTWRQASFPTQSSACDPGGTSCFLFPKAVSATSPSDVWVVGTILEPNPTGNFAAHWDGSSWQVVNPPCLQGTTVVARCSGSSVDLNELTGVAAVSPADAWASGSEGNVNNQNFHIPYVLHWNGTAWSLVKTPNPNSNGEGSLLNAIASVSANDIWAVGQTQTLNGTIKTVTEHFTGAAWAVVPAPSPGSPTFLDDSLDAVASAGGGVVFAGGARTISGQCCLRTLALRTAIAG